MSPISSYESIPYYTKPGHIYHLVPVEKDGETTGYMTIEEGFSATADPLSAAQRAILYWCNATLGLRAINADLLAACEALVEAYAFEIEPFESETIDQARTAIAKARGVEVLHLAGQDVEVQFSGDYEDLAAMSGPTKPAEWEGKIISGTDVSGEEE